MANTKQLYRAINVETGEELEGDSQYFAERFGIRVQTFYAHVNEGTKANGVWMINHSTKEPVKSKNYGLEQTLKEWGEFTRPIQEYIRRRDNGKKTFNTKGNH